MKRNFEKYILLALSLILVSTYAISSAVVKMREYYVGVSAEKIDLIVSIPSFGILCVVLLNIFFSKYLKERFMIISGLCLIAITGMAPIFYQGYGFVLASRFLLGIGLGMVNAKAVSVISERYEGNERAKLLGYRVSAEALGNTALTLIAGGLLVNGWTKVFYIYELSIVLLGLYVCFIPKVEEKEKEVVKTSMSIEELKIALRNVILGFLSIGACTVVMLRLSVLMVSKGLGTDTMASTVQSIMQTASIFAGLSFGFLKKHFDKHLEFASLIITIISLLGIAYANSLIMMIIMNIIFGFSYTYMITCAFTNAAECLPSGVVDKGNSMILVGCNLGASCCAYIIKFSNLIMKGNEAPFYLYGICILLISINSLLKMRKKNEYTK